MLTKTRFLRVFDASSAREGFLKRQALEDTPLSPGVQASIQRMFGEALAPAQVVEHILKDVQIRGDLALRDWTEKLDGQAPASLRIPQVELDAALDLLNADLRLALEQAADRVRRFHQAQPVTSWITQQMGGTLGQLVRPIRRVGLYIPAGSAPLPSTVLMSAIPAQVAGVKEIVLVVPPHRDSGQVAPVILAVVALLGIKEVYAVGGAQAIGALAYGTDSIPRVDKIFGPGNLFVTLAKRQVYGLVGIDALAGPTETVIVADDSARPEWVAADLMAQAEHDTLAAAILLTPSLGLIEKVEIEIGKQIEARGRAEIIRASLENRSGAVLTADLTEAVELANRYAPEHLCLAVSEPWAWVDKVQAAGGVFIGEQSFEVLGDYIAGPSHVMPTSGSARFSSPLNVLDFVHLISLVALDPATTHQIVPAAAVIAEAEGLDAHANAARVRISNEHIASEGFLS